ncbi:SRPBCC family protein [Amycolatopsis sp.]|uniref:SRPBCC family protein n=1 Tax=Amycolatopsis sp. TaxID=37632 RepID=UPI002B8FBFE2|nr:SRPBCC family protein [Amycolatopsis sp.]HVV12036.1 SRPBCC family protein [Amycolatopsis sp.]
MAEFESTITVDRPVGEVFDLVRDLENARYFDPQCVSVHRTTSGTIGVGTSFEFREPVPPFGRIGRTVCTYTALEAPERIVVEFCLGAFRGSECYLLSPDGAGTRLTTRGTVRVPLLLRPLSFVVASHGKRVWHARLRWIKNWIEAGAPRDGSWQPRAATPPKTTRTKLRIEQ